MTTKYRVAILTHQSTAIPFEETIADWLTQFVVDAGASLHTSILVEGLHATLDIEAKKSRKETGKRRQQPQQAQRLVLVNTEHYLKECVATTAQFQNQSADVVITLCHGFGPDDSITSGGSVFGAKAGATVQARPRYMRNS